MKQSRIRRLISKKLARELASSNGRLRAKLETKAERESGDVIDKMRSRGFQLVTRLDTGEGVFVREERVTALHVQLPAALYKRLDAECRRREVSKKTVVVEALERLLDAAAS